MRDRLARVGLRWRLLAWVAAVIVVCLGIVFVAVYRGTGTQVQRQIDTEISGDAREFAHNIELADPRSPRAIAAAAADYVRGQPFRAGSTLLFTTVPGLAPVSNSPDVLYEGPPDDGETAPQQRRENRLAARLLGASIGFRTLHVADIGLLRVLKQAVAFAGVPSLGDRVVIGVGEPLAAVSQAERGVANAFILGAILALAAALLGAFLIGTRMSGPLRRMATVATQINGGDLRPRIQPSRASANEVRTLADAFNHMLDRLTEAFAGQRAFVADASHELRTPLTVIRGQLELLAAQDDPALADVRRVERLVQSEIARMSRLVDDLLLLARSEHAEFLRVESIDVAPFVEELWDGTTLVASRNFKLQSRALGRLQADPDRLAQALRNLLANAIEHTAPETGLVTMRVEPFGRDGIRFVVEDDGPGIPVDQRERVFARFQRTDSARDRASGGTGLGLAIVEAIATAHGGRVEAGEAPAGGARVTIELPRFVALATPAPASARRLVGPSGFS